MPQAEGTSGRRKLELLRKVLAAPPLVSSAKGQDEDEKVTPGLLH